MSDENSKAAALTNAVTLQQTISLQHLYFNGFELSTTSSDVGLLMMVDGQPTAKVALSFTVAKTLAETLTTAINDFEKVTSHKLMTINEVATKLAQSKKK